MKNYLKKDQIDYKSEISARFPDYNPQNNQNNANLFYKRMPNKNSKEEILKSFNLQSYIFQTIPINHEYKRPMLILEQMLKTIENILGFHIYKLIYDLYNVSRRKDLTSPTISNASTNISLAKPKNCHNFNNNLTFFGNTIKPENTIDFAKEQYFKQISLKLQKLEIHENLDKVYDNAIKIYLSKHCKTFEAPLQIPKTPPKSVLYHSNSLNSTPKKNKEDLSVDGLRSPLTPDKKLKRVSFHEEVTVQIFSEMKPEIVRTVKKEEKYKERGKKILSFLEFKEKQENQNTQKSSTKTLLKFISNNHNDNMQFLKKFSQKTENIGFQKFGEDCFCKDDGKKNTNNGRRGIKLINFFK